MKTKEHCEKIGLRLIKKKIELMTVGTAKSKSTVKKSETKIKQQPGLEFTMNN